MQMQSTEPVEQLTKASGLHNLSCENVYIIPKTDKPL